MLILWLSLFFTTARDECVVTTKKAEYMRTEFCRISTCIYVLQCFAVSIVRIGGVHLSCLSRPFLHLRHNNMLCTLEPGEPTSPQLIPTTWVTQTLPFINIDMHAAFTHWSFFFFHALHSSWYQQCKAAGVECWRPTSKRGFWTRHWAWLTDHSIAKRACCTSCEKVSTLELKNLKTKAHAC